MALAKIDICNIGLAALGSTAIRSFNEDNKRSRQCDIFYPICRDYLLEKFDWPFARARAELQEVVVEEPVPDHQWAFALPGDCMKVRDVDPEGSRTWWNVRGEVIYVCQPYCTIAYTRQTDNAHLFSSTFSDLLASRMAVKMGPALTQDKRLMVELRKQYETDQQEAWEADANEDNIHPGYDNNPENDTFVHPNKWAQYRIPGEEAQ